MGKREQSTILKTSVPSPRRPRSAIASFACASRPAPSYSRLPPSLSPACLASKCSTTLPSALLIHLSSEERIDALSRKWLKLSAGGNLEHKLEPLASARDLLE